MLYNHIGGQELYKRAAQRTPCTIKRTSTYHQRRHPLSISTSSASDNSVTPAKNMQIQTALVLFSLIAISIEVARSTPLSTSHCSARFQETFKEALSIKRTCQEALYDGCCQVWQSFCPCESPTLCLLALSSQCLLEQTYNYDKLYIAPFRWLNRQSS